MRSMLRRPRSTTSFCKRSEQSDRGEPYLFAILRVAVVIDGDFLARRDVLQGRKRDRLILEIQFEAGIGFVRMIAERTLPQKQRRFFFILAPKEVVITQHRGVEMGH